MKPTFLTVGNKVPGYVLVTTEILSILLSVCEFLSSREYGCTTL